MTKPRAAVSWSGGKDCALALHRACERFEIAGLLTVFTDDGSRTRSHGLRPEVIAAQARALGLPLLSVTAAWSNYESQFEDLLRRAAAWRITHVIFGDVFPDSHRQWAESLCSRAGLAAVEPLWAESTAALAAEFIETGGRAIIVAAREDLLGAEWLGRELDMGALDALRELDLDPGGENGEFHTVVTRFPGANVNVPFVVIGTLSHGGCRLLDLAVDYPGVGAH